MKYFIVFSAVIFSASIVVGQEIQWTGFGAAGYRNINRQRIIEYNQEMYFSAKVQAEISINKQIEGQIDIRGNSQDQQMELREVSVKFRYLKNMNIKFGNLKKPFTAEQIESFENLIAVERSNLSHVLGEIGYGGRSIGIMAYYNSSGKKDDLPYSYYLFLYKNNNLQQGLNIRGEYHIDDDYSTALSYFVLHTGGDYPMVTNAVSPGLYLRKKKIDCELEFVLAQNPVEGIRHKAIGENSEVIMWGARMLAAISFNTEAEIIKEIEPLAMISYYQPELKYTSEHTLQLLAGVNFYFHKDVRTRMNADFILSRNRYNDKYSLYGSTVTLELQVRY